MTSQGLVVLFVVVAIVILSITANAQSPVSVAAEFIRELDPPGTSNTLLRPQQIFIDKRFGEVFVVDTGNNRVVVFDTSGVFKFEFSGREEFGSPSDLVVSSEGYIFVVGTRQREGGSIFKFDYDGAFLGRLELSSLPDSSVPDIERIAVDEADNLYLVLKSADRIVKIDAKGQYLGEFGILSDLEDKERLEVVLGSPRIDGDLLYLPVSMFGVVYVYDLEGGLVRTIGTRGNNVGELNFPSAVAVIDHSIVVVVDKHRYCIVCYTTEGEFLGEFGGMGYSPGWFYHPEYVAVDNLDRIYIGQFFLNRVQVCGLPEFIKAKAQSSKSSTSQTSFQPLLPEAMKEEVTLETKNPVLFSRSFFYE